ncbi:MAG: IS110 family transposase [Chloroflexota bacterium]|nr:IS110 family transposase [Chloroflexota bacterium]
MPDRAMYHLFVGLDVAATTFTATWRTPTADPVKPVTLPQTTAGYHQLQQHLRKTQIAPAKTFVVLEATGSYWVTVAVALHQAGYAVSVVHPNHVTNYAKSLPRRAKTDACDAHLLVHFALERQPAVWTPPPQVYHELRQRLVARDALLAMRQQARNHHHALVQWPVQVATVKAQLDAVIADLEVRITTLEQEIEAVLADSAWTQSAMLLRTINSVGPLTTAWLLVLTLNFEHCPTSSAAAAYAGLVPMAHESGSSVRGRARLGHGGNKRLRTTLYLATLNAARFNPVIREFYERLRAKGKPKKVARCAAARKLLQIAWAVVTTGIPFDPTYQQQHVVDR